MEAVRSTCKTVAENARFVRIHVDAIASYAASLPVGQALAPEIDAERHYLGHGDDTAAFFLTLDTINFGSGYFPHMQKRPGMSGYFTIASSLNDHFKTYGPLSPEKLAGLTTRQCTEIFGQDPQNQLIQELMGHFAKALNDLGRYLADRFRGSFTRMVESADASAERLAELLVEMPYFKDVAPYKNKEVPFYKRAQLAAADLSSAFSGKGLGYFRDLDQLTLFADNLVPHVLRIDKVLIYDPTLVRRIDAGELIPAGSKEEVEIRACAVHAVELLKNALIRSGFSVTSAGLDALLWHRGQHPYYKSFPRHRTRSVFY